MPHPNPLPLIALVGLGVLGCGEELLEPGDIELQPGLESEVWTAPDSIAEVLVTATELSGESREIGRYDAPIEGFSLGRGSVSRFHVRGSDAAGETLVSADTIWIDPSGLSERVIPLLAGPAGTFGRADHLTDGPGQITLSSVIAERYILAVHGVKAQLYDLGLWRSSESFELPCPGETCQIDSMLVVAGWIGVFIGPGGASFYDFGTGQTGQLKAPEGGSFDQVRGGSSHYSTSGTAWLVGGARSTEASDRVLQIATDGSMSFLRLGAARKGAAVTFADGLGLIVAGGSETGAGAERLKPGDSAFEAVGLPPDPTEGAALFESPSGLFRIGGGLGQSPAETQRIEVGCAAPCTPEPVGEPLGLWGVRVAQTELGDVLVGGESDTGESRWLRLETESLPPVAVPLTTRVGRTGGLLQALPTGQVALFGGVSPSAGSPVSELEIYFQR